MGFENMFLQKMPLRRKQKRKATLTTIREKSQTSAESPDNDTSIPEIQEAIEATEGQVLDAQVEDIPETQKSGVTVTEEQLNRNRSRYSIWLLS